MDTLDMLRTSEKRRTLTGGEILFRVGDESDSMYAVAEGALDVIVGGAIIETVGPGGIVGEMALAGGGSLRSATVRARTETTVVPVGEDEFVELVHSTPQFALLVIRTLAERLRHTNELLR